MDDNKKLKILCLHGYNNTPEIFKFQLRYFIESYSKYADFIFLDGPFACCQKPIGTFMKMGYKGC